MCANEHSPPIREADFNHIMKMFHLPLATPSVYRTSTPHFQQYTINSEAQETTGLGKSLTETRGF